MNFVKIRVKDVMVVLEFRYALPEECSAAMVIGGGSIVRPSLDKARRKEILKWGPNCVRSVFLGGHLGVPRCGD